MFTLVDVTCSSSGFIVSFVLLMSWFERVQGGPEVTRQIQNMIATSIPF